MVVVISIVASINIASPPWIANTLGLDMRYTHQDGRVVICVIRILHVHHDTTGRTVILDIVKKGPGDGLRTIGNPPATAIFVFGTGRNVVLSIGSISRRCWKTIPL